MAALPCPCTSGRAYVDCCGTLHHGQPAANAETLMRARYSAYVLQRADYLLATWDPQTRPPVLDLSDPPGSRTHWLGLQIREHKQIDAEHAEVEFVARYRVNGGRAVRMRERSRFRYLDGWLYVDGDVSQG